MSDAETHRQVRPPERRDSLQADRSEDRAFLRILGDATGRLRDEDIDHVVMGGVAVAAFGRPRWTHDIDLFVRPDDASQALQALADAGYETEQTDTLWLFKAWRDDVLVDLIFRSRGDYYLDDRMVRRSREVDFKGQRVRVVPPEDLLVIKAAAHREDAPYHWFDALALLTHADLDREYLLDRPRRSVRRVLSLLIYAESSDIAVPVEVVRHLMRYQVGRAFPRVGFDPVGGPADDGDVTAIQERLRAHPEIGKLDLEVSSDGTTVVLGGQVPTDERRREIGAVARRLTGGEECDVLLLAGDLTRRGRPAEMRTLVGELDHLALPMVAVLGNHDLESDRQATLRRILESAGVTLLEGESTVVSTPGGRLGVAGTVGFAGGFPGARCADFGEWEMKAFVRRSRRLADGLLGALRKVRHADRVVALTHYAPVRGTLVGESPEVYPFLGSDHLAEAIDAARPDLAVHGHAHHGSPEASTPGGVPVRNVARPVIGAPCMIAELGVPAPS